MDFRQKLLGRFFRSFHVFLSVSVPLCGFLFSRRILFSRRNISARVLLERRAEQQDKNNQTLTMFSYAEMKTKPLTKRKGIQSQRSDTFYPQKQFAS